MRRFYFDMRDCRGDHQDDYGDMFRDIADAEQQALALLLHVGPQDLQGQECSVTTCRVRDERGLVIYEARMVRQGKRFPNGVDPAALDAMNVPSGVASVLSQGHQLG